MSKEYIHDWQEFKKVIYGEVKTDDLEYVQQND